MLSGTGTDEVVATTGVGLGLEDQSTQTLLLTTTGIELVEVTTTGVLLVEKVTSIHPEELVDVTTTGVVDVTITGVVDGVVVMTTDELHSSQVTEGEDTAGGVVDVSGIGTVGIGIVEVVQGLDSAGADHEFHPPEPSSPEGGPEGGPP